MTINSECGNYRVEIEANANDYTLTLFVNNGPALWSKDVKHLGTARKIAADRLRVQAAYAGRSVHLVQSR